METETIKFDSEGDVLLLLTHPMERVDLSHRLDAMRLKKRKLEAIAGSAELVVWIKEYRMLVSSKHLMHISKPFKAMLRRDGFKEGQDLQTRGDAPIEIPLPDDDAPAMLILLDLIHHNYRNVPRTVDLDTMTNISILADKYQMTEVLYTHSEIWLNELKKTVPRAVTKDLLPWLSIACVFKLPAEFKHLTRISALESDGQLSSVLEQDLPIPASVFDAIEAERKRGISEMFAVLQKYIEKYQAGPVNCKSTHFSYIEDQKTMNYACDGSILGTLLKSAADNGLWPPTPSPYDGLTLRMVMRKAQALNISALCDYVDLENEIEDTAGLNHGVKAAITGTIKRIKAGLGLNINNFKS